MTLKIKVKGVNEYQLGGVRKIELDEEYLRKWQSAISGHLSAEEIRRAEISRIKRLAEFAKLRADGVTVMYGDFAGQLLADILEGDLMENESIKGEKICRT